MKIVSIREHIQISRSSRLDTAMSDPHAGASPDLSSLSISSSVPTNSSEFESVSAKDAITAEIPTHRSHDPSNNLKRSDPFKFGSRYLQSSDDVYEFNAWDHVIPDATYYEYAETQYANQKASPVSDFDKQRFNNEPAKWWNKFYSNNTSNFFKDRKWLHQEFPILSTLTSKDAEPAIILEVGAGAGNTAFPILKLNENPGLMIHACDFSSRAVDLMRENAAYDTQYIQASVWDISGESLPDGVSEGSVDVVLLVFIFSALSPLQWDAAVRNVWRVLKPGGEVCFRDYGKGDLTQVRFKKGRLMEDNFYIRGDGTRVYFFEEVELKRIWGGHTKSSDEESGGRDKVPSMDRAPQAENAMMGINDYVEETTQTEQGHKDEAVTNGSNEQTQKSSGSSPDDTLKEAPLSSSAFEIVSLGVDRRMLVNRQKQLKMYRCWMQGRFKKPCAVEG